MDTPLQAVIFDLDGTLIDSAPDLQAAANHMLDELGRAHVSLEQITMMVGDGVPKLVERALEATGGVADADFEACVERFLHFYEGHGADLTRAYPGVPETLARLKAQGLKLGVCTNKPHGPALEILQALGLAQHLDAVVGGDSLPGIRKPDPRHALACIDRLGSTPETTAMVGDNRNDVEAGHNAGLPVIAVAYGYPKMPLSELGADRLIETFDLVPEALESL